MNIERQRQLKNDLDRAANAEQETQEHREGRRWIEHILSPYRVVVEHGSIFVTMGRAKLKDWTKGE